MRVTLKEILIVRNNSSKRPGCNQEDREAREKKSLKNLNRYIIYTRSWKQ